MSLVFAISDNFDKILNLYIACRKNNKKDIKKGI